MNYKIGFTPEAEDTYVSIMLQLQIQWGAKFVELLEDKIRKSISNISKNPFMYPPAGDNANIRKCVLHKNCSMIYSVRIDHVDVVCFWDNRQEPLTF